MFAFVSMHTNKWKEDEQIFRRGMMNKKETIEHNKKEKKRLQ
jgi:hypothetical protein